MVLRSCRKAVGSRVEISPRGFQIMISTIASAEQQHAVLRRIELAAEYHFQEVELAQ